jgi:hypothetical protein
MKKHMLNIAAIILAVSASAFTTNHDLAGKKLVSYKWFRVNSTKVMNATVTNSDVTYLSEGETPPTDPNCTDANVNQCISGFTPGSQVNASNQIVGTQLRAAIGHSKN